MKKRLQTQICICGGGPAGFIAAIAAARNGCRTALVEPYGFPGGMATAGLVGPISKFNSNGKRIIGGIPLEFITRLGQTNGAILDLPSGNIPFDSECYKQTALEMLWEANVTTYFHSTACFPEFSSNGELTEIKILTGGSVSDLKADYFIDCTGTGVLLAGKNDLWQWRTQQSPQPLSLIFKLGGVKTSELPLLMRDDRVKYANLVLRQAIMAAAESSGLKSFGGPWTVWGSTMHPGTVSVNCTRCSGNPCDPENSGETARRLRLEIPRFIEVFRKADRAFSDAYLLESAVMTGHRESREVLGLYRMTADDLLNGTDFPDSIALGGHPLDRHYPEAGKQEVTFLDRPYGISFQCLVPKTCPNLLVAGSLAAASPDAFASIRTQAQCMAMGQASGTAAAIAFQKQLAVWDINGVELRQTLESQKAITRIPS